MGGTCDDVALPGPICVGGLWVHESVKTHAQDAVLAQRLREQVPVVLARLWSSAGASRGNYTGTCEILLDSYWKWHRSSIRELHWYPLDFNLCIISIEVE